MIAARQLSSGFYPQVLPLPASSPVAPDLRRQARDLAQRVRSLQIETRRTILEMAFRAHVGHIGSALSVSDILLTLYCDVLNIPSHNHADRDRFVLSKGHAAMALYAAMHTAGLITRDEMNSFHQDGTRMGVHPDHSMRGVDFSTGSLGQGLGMGAGAALAARLQNSSRRVFVLLSDAECNEGSVWEAIMFASHHQLSNLVAIIDLNGQQALGHTRDVMDLSPMRKRWEAFGWQAVEVDGHNPVQMSRALCNLDTSSGAPHVMIARTVSGKGVSFMEGQVKWHYWPMSEQEYRQAINEIGVA